MVEKTWPYFITHMAGCTSIVHAKSSVYGDDVGAYHGLFLFLKKNQAEHSFKLCFEDAHIGVGWMLKGDSHQTFLYEQIRCDVVSFGTISTLQLHLYSE